MTSLRDEEAQQPLLSDDEEALIDGEKTNADSTFKNNGRRLFRFPKVIEVHREQIMGSSNATIKIAVLIWLVLQNSVHTLLLRYSRARDVQDMFFSSVAVFFTEVIKAVICLYMVGIEENGFLGLLDGLQSKILAQPWDTLKVCIPAMLYTVQNNLFYVAASHLEAATFMIVSQLKIFATAMFSVLLLQRHLARAQWFSLGILFVGVSLVQLTTNSSSSKNKSIEQNPLFGFTAACVACGISGFAGVYFEKILKGSAPVSIWMRNVQMAVFAIPASFAASILQDGPELMDKGFFFGFDWVVWLTVLWYGIGGLSVAVCIKYADNIAKNFATSVAIILATLGSVYVFGFVPNFMFTVGACLVIFSIFLYSSSAVVLKLFYSQPIIPA
uniref:UDP-galactose transporter n=1 Tax=Panagrolaimus sp. JU765 TaxID=591449 RepID=A0AC34QKC5_9BILA